MFTSPRLRARQAAVPGATVPPAVAAPGWRSRDGHLLRLDLSRAWRIASRMARDPALWRLVRRHWRGDLVDAVRETAHVLSERAAWAGTLHLARSNQVLWVYEAAAGNRIFELITLPDPYGTGQTLLRIRDKFPDDLPDFIHRRGEVTVPWDCPIRWYGGNCRQLDG